MSIVSLGIFLRFYKKYQEFELQRLHDISPLILRPIEANYIIGDDRSTTALINQLIEQYHLSRLVISIHSSCHTNNSLLKNFFPLKNQHVCLTISIPNIRPNHVITIESTLDKYDLKSLLRLLSMINVPLIMLGFFISFILRKKLEQFIATPLKLLSKNPQTFPSNIYATAEIVDLHQKFILFIYELEKQRDIIEENKIKQSIIKIATQVAHDIRSPLAAITTAVFDIRKISKVQQTIIKNAAKSINDIAQNLLLNFKSTNNKLNNEFETAQPELIFSAIENVIAEKQYEYYGKKIIDIKLNIENTAYNSFSRINLISFKRLLSNLINNSIEAIQFKGTIEIFLRSNNHNIEIVVNDDGCGIPAAILPKVTEQGFSYSKNAGTGLGLFYAKQKIEEYGGQFLIQSEINVGTKITILLPYINCPSWFCGSITINNKPVIVILDDDDSFHQTWEKKFSAAQNACLIHLYSEDKLTSDLIEKSRPNLYLFEYEFFNNHKNGIDLIKKFELINTAILVTHASEDSLFRQRCQNIGIKIIPKPYVKYIPIKHSESLPRTVFIDDHSSMRMAWEFSALEAGLDIITYSSPKNFIQDISNYNKNTVIYIDSELGENMRGELYAKEFYNMGFTEIHLVTGHPLDKFSYMPWIKSIVGKEPPFLTLKSNAV